MALAITSTAVALKASSNVAVQLAASGSTGPVSWSLVSGTLPGGLLLSSDGRITGIPGITGVFTVSVSATDTGTVPSIANTSGTPLTVTGVTTANPGVVATSTAHGLQTGQTVTIAGVVGAPQANGTWPVTVLSPTTFSIPVNVTGAWSGGGTVTVLSNTTLEANSQPTPVATVGATVTLTIT